MAGTRSTVSSVTGPLQMVELMVQTAMIDICPVSADLRPNTPSLSLPVDLPSPAGGRGVAWPRESSQPKLFPEATNQFQVGSRRAEQVQPPRHQLTSYPGRCGGAARPATGWCGAAPGRQLRQVRGPERTQCSAQ